MSHLHFQIDRYHRCTTLRCAIIDGPLILCFWDSSCRPQELPPESLIAAHVALVAKYPDDRFDIVTRAVPSGEQEWRVKCFDCPGKVHNLIIFLFLCITLTIEPDLYPW
jgi:hypothetical protein